MVKGLVNGVSNLMELLDGAGATEEVAEVRKKVELRQRWLEEKYRGIGVAAMTLPRDDNISFNSQSRTSLSSEQQRRGR